MFMCYVLCLLSVMQESEFITEFDTRQWEVSAAECVSAYLAWCDCLRVNRKRLMGVVS